MPIERDDKDWTWVLERTCPECGFDAASVDAREVGARLRAELHTWSRVLAGPTATQRPDDSTWSPTEYGCHVRDVAILYRQRLDRMLGEDNPLYANWSSDDAAEAGRYADAGPADVIPQLVREVEQLADAFDAVTGEQWGRPGRRSDGASFTVDSFSRYLLHDVVHHTWDITRIR
jgi:hypothetical protein